MTRPTWISSTTRLETSRLKQSYPWGDETPTGRQVRSGCCPDREGEKKSDVGDAFLCVDRRAVAGSVVDVVACWAGRKGRRGQKGRRKKAAQGHAHILCQERQGGEEVAFIETSERFVFAPKLALSVRGFLVFDRGISFFSALVSRSAS